MRRRHRGDTWIGAEKIVEGYIITHTLDIDEAWKALNYQAQVPYSEHDQYVVRDSGFFRKVPAQWSDFALYKNKPEGSKRGAFPCVIFWKKNLTDHKIIKGETA